MHGDVSRLTSSTEASVVALDEATGVAPSVGYREVDCVRGMFWVALDHTSWYGVKGKEIAWVHLREQPRY